ncbi:MAG TPA: hypothetical protein DGD08_16700 [Gemmatimonas aurantiaca]|uniref:DUF308 domain-containing protein n=2 Tax=Gemmatimonas aurantiaca TaxID=173480 RepID=A0A3D4VCK6_9BACT|nr:hypothetical protein [Gemmatimonas aurantiaca]BAH37126.1 hypothetical membrane protein [Gemmatimonas aurantiaca T-27]HCT58841.1 hypothetical protein [Gemmatimonas aurantiaca]
MTTERSLDDQRREFAARRFLAMPLAGTIAWIVAGIAGALLPPVQATWALFIATGSIVYLGLVLSRFTGENFTSRTRPKNTFDRLFLYTVGMSLLVYAIAIPFFMLDYTSLPLTVGILAGLMWMPLSWIIRHGVGLFHAITRTVLVTAAWFLLPTQRFTVIPAVIVAVYAVTIVILERRWRALATS